jgi:hypothetical protein
MNQSTRRTLSRKNIPSHTDNRRINLSRRQLRIFQSWRNSLSSQLPNRGINPLTKLSMPNPNNSHFLSQS